MKQERKIPTIIGLILLITGVVAGVFLVNRSTNFISKASGDCEPINPQITNITHNSFDISFLTTDSCLSALNIDSRSIYDIRFANLNKTPTANKIHYFSITNLKENTDYSFSFIMDGKEYSKSEYKAKTAQKPTSNTPLSNLAWGRVFTPDLKPAVNSIVYLNIPGGSPLSSFVTSNGNWNIPLATSFNADKNNWFNPPSNTDEEIVVLTQDSPGTQITSNTDRNNPVPDIIIGQNQFASLPVTGSESLIAVSSISGSRSLEIKSPTEGETVNTKKPDIFGYVSSNTTVNLSLSSGNINGSTKSSSDGTWHWSYSGELSPGSYIITASAVNSKTGSVETVSRKFSISPTASSLAFTSSPSATLITPTLIPTLIPTSIPTSTITTTLTPTKTPTKSPTTAPTTRPTSTPKPTIVVKATIASTQSGIPATGSTAATVFLVSLAGLLMAASFLL